MESKNEYLNLILDFDFFMPGSLDRCSRCYSMHHSSHLRIDENFRRHYLNSVLASNETKVVNHESIFAVIFFVPIICGENSCRIY